MFFRTSNDHAAVAIDQLLVVLSHSRYDEKTEIEARGLFEAVSHKPDGVFLWIQSRWQMN